MKAFKEADQTLAFLSVGPLGERRAYMDLLLLADPCVEMVERYLGRGVMLAAVENGQAVGVIVAVPEAEECWEIKNLAVREDMHRRGFGRALIAACERECQKRGASRMTVGTADTSHGNLDFYEKCGYRRERVLKNFFTDNYPEPVYDEGEQCVDMIYLGKTL